MQKESTFPTLLLALTLAVTLTLVAPRGVAAAGPAEPTEPPPQLSIRTENGRVVLEGAGDPVQRERRVRRWYAAWSREIVPVHEAAALVDRVLRHEHRSMLPGACRILGRALLDFDRPARWPAPDYALHRHLRDQLDHLTRAATACLTERRAATEAELRRARQARAQAKLVLKALGR